MRILVMLVGYGTLQLSYSRPLSSIVVNDVKAVSAEMKRFIKLHGTDVMFRGRRVVESIVAVVFGYKDLDRLLGGLFRGSRD